MRRLFVSGVIPDAPADLAGVEAGDLVYGIDDEPDNPCGLYRNSGPLEMREQDCA